MLEAWGGSYPMQWLVIYINKNYITLMRKSQVALIKKMFACKRFFSDALFKRVAGYVFILAGVRKGFFRVNDTGKVGLTINIHIFI